MSAADKQPPPLEISVELSALSRARQRRCQVARCCNERRARRCRRYLTLVAIFYCDAAQFVSRDASGAAFGLFESDDGERTRSRSLSFARLRVCRLCSQRLLSSARARLLAAAATNKIGQQRRQKRQRRQNQNTAAAAACCRLRSQREA